MYTYSCIQVGQYVIVYILVNVFFENLHHCQVGTQSQYIFGRLEKYWITPETFCTLYFRECQ